MQNRKENISLLGKYSTKFKCKQNTVDLRGRRREESTSSFVCKDDLVAFNLEPYRVVTKNSSKGRMKITCPGTPAMKI
jgi:hypothetical protein